MNKLWNGLGLLAVCLAANAAVEFTTPERSVLDSAGLVLVELRSTEAFTANTQISVTIAPSTAVQGVDFELPVPYALFTEGATSAFLKLMVVANPAATGDRTLVLALSEVPPGTELGSHSRQTITLRSSANASYYSFEKATYYVNERASSARVRVKRLGDSSRPGSVSYSIAAGTAAPEDAELVSQVLEFGDSSAAVFGDRSLAEFTVAIRDNALPDGDRYLELSLPTLAGQPEGLITSARLVIVDNEGVSADPLSIEQYRKGELIDVYSVSFATRPGFRYVVEAAEAAAGEPWSEFQTIIGDGEIHSAVDLRPTSPVPTRFYRFRLEDDLVTR